MITTYAIKRRDIIVLLIILFIAALLRLDEPGIVEFFHDEAMLSTLAQSMAAGESFPLTGINSSTGIPNPPVSVYVMALPFALSSDPLFATLFVATLNVVGVGLLWLLAHRYAGPTVGLVAGLTYAVSPWAVLFSRKIWAQDFHTPFILLALLLAVYGAWEAAPRAVQQRFGRHQWAQALTIPVMLWGMQIHFAAWALLPVFGWVAWRARSHLNWRALALGLTLGLVVLLPFLVGLTQTLQSDPTRISAAAQRSDINAGFHFDIEPLAHVARLVTGYGLETWVAPEQQADMLNAVPPPALWWLLGMLALLGTGVGLWKRSTRAFTIMLLIWGLLPPLVLVPRWTPVYIHYFIGSIPAYALLIGLGTAWISRIVPLKAVGRAIILVAFAVILLTQALWWRGALRYLDNTAITYPGFTTPLANLNAVSDALRTEDDVIVLSYGMSWSLHHESAVWPVLLHDSAQCVRTLVPQGYAVFPAQPFAVLVAPDAPPDPVDNLYETDSPEIYPTRPGDTPYVIHRWPQSPPWRGPAIETITPVMFDNGITLTGYHLDSDTVYLSWQLPAPTEDITYHYSAQLFDAADERLAQRDAVLWQQRHWCEGDRLITWGSINTSSEATELRVGLYQLGEGAAASQFFNANILDEAGQPTGQYVKIPLLQ